MSAADTSSRSGSCAPTPGVELASFRETGDGPRGLIDAADKLARALRAQGGRIAAVGERDAAARAGDYELARRAAKVQRGGRAPTCSATTDAIAAGARGNRDRLHLRLGVEWTGCIVVELRRNALRHRLGADAGVPLSRSTSRPRARSGGRALLRTGTRTRSGQVDQRIRKRSLQRGDSSSAVLVNLAEVLRTRRDFARAESLNVWRRSLAREPRRVSGTRLKCSSTRERSARRRQRRLASERYRPGTLHMSGFTCCMRKVRTRTVHALADSLVRKGEGIRHLFGLNTLRSLSLRDGRLADQARAAQGDDGESFRSAIAGRFPLRDLARRDGEGTVRVAQRAPRLGDRRGAVSRAPDGRPTVSVFGGRSRSCGQRGEGARDDRALSHRNDRHVHPARAGGRAAFGARRDCTCRSQAAGRAGGIPPRGCRLRRRCRRTNARHACHSTLRARSTPRENPTPLP